MSNKGEKKKGLGTLDFFCVGFGSIIGVGWAVSINKWMGNSGGALPAAFGYIIVLVLMIPVALCYCELAPMMPVAGGSMAYAYRAFNEQLAFIGGWAAFGALVTLLPWEAIYVCDILSIAIPAVKGPVLYTLAGANIHLGHIILGTIFSTLLFWVNWRGATTSAMMQNVLTLILLGIGILAIIMALAKFDASNFQPIYQNVGRGSHNGFFGGAIAIMLTAPFFMCGFEAIPQAVEDAGGNIVSVGKTVVMAVGAAALFYALLLFSLGGAFPWQTFSPANDPATGELIYSGLPSPAVGSLFQGVYQGSLGVILYYLIMVGALCGLFTSWNGFMIASPRLLMGMARGYMVPSVLGKQHPKYNTPTTALIACYILSLSGPFLGMGLIDPLTSFAGAAFVLSWGLAAFCVVKLRKSEPDVHRPYKMPGGAPVAAIAGTIMAVLFVLMFIPGNPVYMGVQAITIFLGWMILGLILYVANAGKRKSIGPEELKRLVLVKHENVA